MFQVRYLKLSLSATQDQEEALTDCPDCCFIVSRMCDLLRKLGWQLEFVGSLRKKQDELISQQHPPLDDYEEFCPFSSCFHILKQSKGANIIGKELKFGWEIDKTLAPQLLAEAMAAELVLNSFGFFGFSHFFPHFKQPVLG